MLVVLALALWLLSCVCVDAVVLMQRNMAMCCVPFGGGVVLIDCKSLGGGAGSCCDGRNLGVCAATAASRVAVRIWCLGP